MSIGFSGRGDNDPALPLHRESQKAEPSPPWSSPRAPRLLGPLSLPPPQPSRPAGSYHSQQAARAEGLRVASGNGPVAARSPHAPSAAEGQGIHCPLCSGTRIMEGRRGVGDPAETWPSGSGGLRREPGWLPCPHRGRPGGRVHLDHPPCSPETQLWASRPPHHPAWEQGHPQRLPQAGELWA